ncbi:MAG: HAMP domain-containing histidine kinase [Spirochaetes bacterium]|nr:HAMP domain-containing histidine kinase [Spirochaetota bacterium]
MEINGYLKKLIISIISILVYLIPFSIFYNPIGGLLTVLLFVPAIVIPYQYGIYRGIIAGIGLSVLHLVLVSYLRNTTIYDLFSLGTTRVGIISVIAITFVTGIISTSNKKLQKEIKRKIIIEEKLRKRQSQLLLSENLIAIGQLAAGIAHEINNPLGVISSNYHTFKKYTSEIGKYRKSLESLVVSDKLPILKNQYDIDFIDNDIDDLLMDNFLALDKIKQIIESLRRFTTVDEKEKRVVFDISKIIDDILLILNEKHKNITIRKEYQQIPNISIDVYEMNQTLYQIILNAIQAINDIKKQDGIINISLENKHDYLYLKIKDNGKGIKPEILKKIFNPFYTTRKIGDGQGLGLYIAHNTIVNQHKGKINIKSKLEKGTEVMISLPYQTLSN